MDKLGAALSKAQGKIRNPEKNKTVTITTKDGRKYTYPYADLPTCYDATRDALAENELSHVCVITHDERGSFLVMRLMHSSGQWIESEFALPAHRVDEKTLAASITYGRRYLFCALVGLAAEEDTDSQPENDTAYYTERKLPSPTPVIAPKPAWKPDADLLAKLMTAAKVDKETVKTMAKKEYQQLTESEFKQLCQQLQTLAEKQKETHGGH